jgi:hypothetical protein
MHIILDVFFAEPKRRPYIALINTVRSSAKPPSKAFTVETRRALIANEIPHDDASHAVENYRVIREAWNSLIVRIMSCSRM